MGEISLQISGLTPEEIDKIKKLISRADVIERMLGYLEYLEDRRALEPLINMLVNMRPLIEYVPDPKEISEAIGRWMEDLSNQIANFVKPLVPAYETIERELSAEDIARAATALVNIVKLSPKIADPEFIEGTVRTIKDLQEYLKAFEPLIIAYRTIIREVSKEDAIKVANTLAILMKLVPIILSPEKMKIFSETLSEELKRPQRYGVLGLMRALRDEDVQRGLWLLIALLKAIGRAYK